MARGHGLNITNLIHTIEVARYGDRVFGTHLRGDAEVLIRCPDGATYPLLGVRAEAPGGRLALILDTTSGRTDG